MLHHLEFSPDGKSFLAQHRIGWPWFTSLFDATTGAQQKTEISGWVDGLAWDPQDRYIALVAPSRLEPAGGFIHSSARFRIGNWLAIWAEVSATGPFHRMAAGWQ